MKSIFSVILLSGILILQSCKKDSAPAEQEDFSSFLAAGEHSFNGKISDSTVSWIYGYYFQLGYYYGTTTASGQPEKKLSFYLLSNEVSGPQLQISIPKYPVGSNELFSNILLPGDKIMGPEFEQFFLRLRLQGVTYTTQGEQAGSRLRILKIEKQIDGIGRDIVKVWFSVNCKFFTPGGAYAFSVKDGKLLASFLYNL